MARNKSDNPVGRPSTLTSEVANKLIKSVKNVYTVKYSAWDVGLSDITVKEWLRIGRELQDTDPSSPLAQFSHKFRGAQLTAIMDLVLQIKRSKQWKAKAWLLEKMFKDDFAADAQQAQDMFMKIESLERTLTQMIARNTNPFTGNHKSTKELYNDISERAESQIEKGS